MTDRLSIRPITSHDLPAMLALLPQLADFDIPANRNAIDLWRSDAKLLEQVARGQSEFSFAEVAVDANDQAVGLILVTMREELMSHAPSAHLEAIVVTPQVRRSGIGAQLLARAEECARSRGAESLTLHVFAKNKRARALYDKQGYDSELIRAVKWFHQTPPVAPITRS